MKDKLTASVGHSSHRHLMSMSVPTFQHNESINGSKYLTSPSQRLLEPLLANCWVHSFRGISRGYSCMVHRARG